MRYWIVILTLIICLGIYFGLKKSGTESTVKSYRISPAEAKVRMSNEPDIILLDVRTIEEHQAKHIPRSMLIPVDVLEKEVTNKIVNKEQKIFIYCRSGRRSSIATQIMRKLGYINVYDLGGINDWPYETNSTKNE
ncbi:MAG TPA: rhodanese-like domain-containing protein [Bacillota bacterium]|jgi:phage shock protein E|nr:rhodanese-like domain-containing protein [Bacillota bacterium]HOL09044.1 rhodanese-like domain-containing protein [Bacillota bacterium]HPO96719.1 rhodanese-like domain-containing protein [Bacillota bacterium]